MKKLVFIVFTLFLLGLTPIKQKDVEHIIQTTNTNISEIQRWQSKKDKQEYIQLKGYKTAELQAIAPISLYIMYWNSETNELWISTGTLTNQFIQK